VVLIFRDFLHELLYDNFLIPSSLMYQLGKWNETSFESCYANSVPFEAALGIAGYEEAYTRDYKRIHTLPRSLIVVPPELVNELLPVVPAMEAFVLGHKDRNDVRTVAAMMRHCVTCFVQGGIQLDKEKR
jgi:hypothetical protein